MKKFNKYGWLAIAGIIVFTILSIRSCKIKSKQSISQPNYPIQVIDNELRVGDVVLYRFIPVDGGYMDFAYKSSIKVSDSDNGVESVNENMNATRKEISSFLIGETPVTVNLLYYLKENKLIPKNSIEHFELFYAGNLKATDWDDVIKKLEQYTGHRFRLPTSEEWEYAARGGQKSEGYKYAGSNNINEVAHYKENTPSERFMRGKEKKPNELGLYDMSGGVLELTSSKLSDVDSFFLLLEDELKKKGEDNFITERISRGGCWSDEKEKCEVRYIMHGVTVKTGARLIMEY